MGAIFLSVLVSVSLYLAVVSLLPKRLLPRSNAYTNSAISRLREQNLQHYANRPQALSFVPENPQDDNPLVRAFLFMPGMQRLIPVLQRAGLWQALDQFVLGFLLIFLFLLFVLAPRVGLLSIPLTLVLTFVLGWFYVRRRITKRQQAFMSQFPDALDTIVRSVRAGHPLNAAIYIIGDNMPPPLGPEFKRVGDEMNYGVSLFEALTRLTERVNEPDVRFFTVVLAVQQESGGNISEALSNLAQVIRKRKELRLRIRALSSEGRTTAWIVGGIPFFMIAVIRYSTPDHLTPLFTNPTGHIILAVAVGMIATGAFIIRQIINMEV